MKIAVDAMGSESAPASETEGALAALYQEPDLEVVLLGLKEPLKNLQDQGINHKRLQFHYVSQKVDMEESPSEALKNKTSSSIAVGLAMLGKDNVDGFVSAGNTGAVVGFSLFSLGRIKGVARPALATFFPTPNGQNLVLDVGANVEAKASHLADYALMGRMVMEKVFHISQPRIGLLNVGHEKGKGRQTVQQAHDLLTDLSLNFIGNVEGSDIFTDKAHVVITDGFTGNVALKCAEGMAATVLKALRDSGHRYRLRGWFSKKIFEDFITRLNYEKAGGAVLLGVSEPVIISHGHSSARAIKNAIRLACFCVREGVIDAIKQEFKD